MTRRGLIRRTRGVGALATIAFLISACDPSHYLAIVNAAPADVIVRVTETQYADDPEIGPTVTSFPVPQGAAGELFPEKTGPLEGAIEILSMDCEVMATVQAQGGSVIEVNPDFSAGIRYTNESDADAFRYAIPAADSEICGDPPSPSVGY
jgi:hypothetical protein